MKKILSALVLINFISAGFIIFAGLALATTTTGPLEKCTINNLSRVTDSGLTCQTNCVFSYGDCPTCCVLNALYNATDVIFFILLGIATIYVILGAMNLLMSAGDPSKVTSGSVCHDRLNACFLGESDTRRC